MEAGIDRSWQALFKPGDASVYFDIGQARLLQSFAAGFDKWNAWWLAEVSRFVYHLEDSGRSADRPALPKVGNISEIARVLDEHTSTLAVLFQSTCMNKLSGHEADCHILAFCGSNDATDWRINIQTFQTNFYGNGSVHRGFRQAFNSIRDELLAEIDGLQGTLFITGHSLGAALATLAVSYFREYGIEYDSCYTFGSPRVGDKGFARPLQTGNIFRLVNACDIVTTLPVSVAGKCVQTCRLGRLYRRRRCSLQWA